MRHNSYRILLEKYTMEDIRRFKLDIPIEVLSKGGCTPEGVLKKTRGMSAVDIRNNPNFNRR